MTYSTIILDKAEGIAILTLNRPEKLNAINKQMDAELLDAFNSVEQDNDVRVLIITGAGRVFCAGADIKDVFLKNIEARKGGGEVYDIAGWLTKACLKLRNLPKPTIASINGTAVGLGVTLPLQCDIRIASEEATLSMPFVRVGGPPEFGSTYSLPRLIGIGKACELIFTGKTITAKQANEIGMVNEVVSSAELKPAAWGLARSICEAAPLAVQMAKKALYQGLDTDLQKQLQYEEQMVNSSTKTEDHEEGVRAFLERRQPIFKGR